MLQVVSVREFRSTFVNRYADCLVVIPTFNERDNIVPMLNALRSLPVALDVLVVDDDSPDGTADLVADYIERHTGVYLMRRKGKKGLGAAYKDGFRFALQHGWQFICQMDADFSHDPADVLRLLESCQKGSDVTLGSRYVHGGQTVGWPWRRKLLSWVANTAARLLLRSGIRDITGGFKCFRRGALESIGLDNISSEGYVFQVEMNHRARQIGLRMKQLPICFTERRIGTSKMGFQQAKEGLRQLICLA